MNKNAQSYGTWFQSMLMALIAIAALPHLAFAQGAGGSDFGSTAAAFVTEELNYVPDLVSAMCYIGGIFLMISGTMKLKEHAENPGNVKMAVGLARLFAGSALVALPPFTGWVVRTTQIAGSGSGASFQQFSSPININ